MRKPVATSVRSAVLVARARVGSVCVGTGLARRHVALLTAAGSRRLATAAERLRAAALPADARPDRIDGGGRGRGVRASGTDLLGKDAAAVPPSLAMAQQIALCLHCDLCGLGTVALHPT